MQCPLSWCVALPGVILCTFFGLGLVWATHFLVFHVVLYRPETLLWGAVDNDRPVGDTGKRLRRHMSNWLNWLTVKASLPSVCLSSNVLSMSLLKIKCL